MISGYSAHLDSSSIFSQRKTMYKHKNRWHLTACLQRGLQSDSNVSALKNPAVLTCHGHIPSYCENHLVELYAIQRLSEWYTNNQQLGNHSTIFVDHSYLKTNGPHCMYKLSTMPFFSPVFLYVVPCKSFVGFTFMFLLWESKHILFSFFPTRMSLNILTSCNVGVKGQTQSKDN